MFKTIRSKFIIISVLFVILSAGIPILILINQFSENFNQRSRIMIRTTTQLLRYELYNAMMKGSDKNIENITATLGNIDNVEHIRIFDENGLIKYSSKISEVGKKLQDIDPRHINLTNLDSTSLRLTSKSDTYSLTEPIVNESRCQSCHGVTKINLAYLDLDTDLTKAETIFFTGSTHMIFLGLAVILILSIGLYIIFTFFINRPLKNLNSAFKSVEAGNLDVEIPSKKNDEIGLVFNRFNLMTKNLKSSREEIEELHFEQLQRADRLTTIGELTSQVAHEVNNHAAVIMSRADFLEMEVSKQNDLKPYIEDFKTILDQTNKISQITKNLLRHSKQTPTTRNKIDLETTISRSIIALEPLMKKKRIKCNFKSDVMNSEIIADELQIEQVMTNLILNALDAIEDEGAIDVSLKSETENSLVVSVKDNGSGIKSDAINKIFSPFYSSKSQGKGTGLGLYIVQNICRSHGIGINCNSEFGRGTTFRLEFKKAI